MSDPLPSAPLAAFLSDRLGERVTETRLLNDGLNLVVLVETERGRYVLRRPNKFRETPLFLGLEREYELLEALAGTGVPAPEPVLFCEDGGPVEGPLQVTTYLDGEVVAVGDDLPERLRTPAARERVAHLLVDCLADVHTLGVERVEGPPRRGPLEGVEHLTDRLDAIEAVTGRDHRRLRSVADWLHEHPPPERERERERALVHGDYRAGNVLLAGDRPDLSGVLDWETALLGDPLVDLGYFLLYWRDPGDRTPSLDPLASRYTASELASVRSLASDGLCPFTAAAGSPSRAELRDRYETQTGVPFEAGQFYLAYAALGLATVWADLHRFSVEHGETSDKPPLVDYMALVAAGITEGELAWWR